MIRRCLLIILTFVFCQSLISAQESQSLGEIARKVRAQKNGAQAAPADPAIPTGAQSNGNTGTGPQPTGSAPLAPAPPVIAEPEEKIVPDLNADIASDVHGTEKYQAAILEMLEQEKFQEIDRLAAEARATKARFPGGYWKVHTIYLALAEPTAKTKAGEAEWTQHFARLEKWKQQFPNSITARIALAEAYDSYGWKARGGSYADQVTDEGWRLLAERAHKGQVILEQAEALPEKCPEWFAAMIGIARSQGWDSDQLNALFQKAVAFEPDYYYYYRMLADSRLPKWGGEEGDAANFAAATADGIGGKKGDLIYFEIATTLVCSCDNVHGLNGLSWPRIKAGYSALKESYGTSISNTNSAALMAFRAGDFDYATALFSEIGDNWDKKIWLARGKFYNFKYLAALPRFRPLLAEAKENGKTPEGQAFGNKLTAEMEKTYRQPLMDCVKTAPDFTESSVAIIMQLTKNGAVSDAFFSDPYAPGGCFRRILEKAVLPNPPNADYWVLVQMPVKK